MTASQEMWRAPRLISVNVCLNYSRVGKYHTGNLNFTLNYSQVEGKNTTQEMWLVPRLICVTSASVVRSQSRALID